MKLNYLFLFFFTVAIGITESNAQYYLKKSVAIGGTDYEYLPHVAVGPDGNIHLVFETWSDDVELNNGIQPLNGYTVGRNFFYVKLDSEGNEILGRYIGGGRNNTPYIEVDDNNIVHLLGQTFFSGYPVVNGGDSHHGNYDIAYTKIDPDGNIIFSTLLGGSDNEYIGSRSHLVFAENGNVGIVIQTNSLDIYNVMGLPVDKPHSGGLDHFFVIFDSSNNPVYATYYGGGSADIPSDLIYGKDGYFYISGGSTSNDLPSTAGKINDLSEKSYLVKYGVNGGLEYDVSVGTRIYTRFPYTQTFSFQDGSVGLISNNISSITYPVLGGSSTLSEVGYTRFDENGTMLFSGYLPTSTSIYGDDFDAFLDSDENVHLTLSIYGPGAYTNNNSSYQGGVNDGMIYYLKMDKDATPLFGTYLGGENQVYLNVDYLDKRASALFEERNEIRFFGQSESGYPLTKYGRDASGSGWESFHSILNHETGVLSHSTYTGIRQVNSRANLVVGSNGDSYVCAPKFSSQTNVPLTTNKDISNVNQDIIFQIYSNICDLSFEIPVDTLNPSNIQVCEKTTQRIVGQPIVIPSTSFPVLYVDGTPTLQPEIEAIYQWQKTSDTLSEPWTDILGEVSKDLIYTLDSTKIFFRRFTLKPDCDHDTLSISQIAIFDPVYSSPTANAGTDIVFCFGDNISIGGSASTTGTGPFTYTWNQGAPSGLPVTVSPQQTTTYELTVTDANNCIAKDQVKATTYKADAGPDVNACINDSVLIGTIGGIGVPGITFNWFPTTNLSKNNVIQTFAKYNGTSENYTLTVEFPQTSGPNCVTTDIVNVNSVAPPNPINFAGNDTTVAFGNTVEIGTSPASAGYQYIWANPIYLNTNNASSVTFGEYLLSFPPNPDPIQYYVTASSLSCNFVDQVSVSVIHADAGPDKCGPATIGGNSNAPGLSESFEWTKQTTGPGTSDFTGPINTPTTTVGAGTVNTTFRLTTTLNEVSTFDEVVVKACTPPSPPGTGGGGGGGPAPPPGNCNVEINVDAPYECASTQYGSVVLSAVNMLHSSSEYTYQWSVIGGGDLGLSSNNTQFVSVTTTDPKSYQVTVTHNIDPNFTCISNTLPVNQSYMNLPIFEATDMAICIGDTATVQSLFAAEYAYEWNPITGLSDPSIYNPLVTLLDSSITYFVTVTDVGAGCVIVDTLEVVAISDQMNADAGKDTSVCTGAAVAIGNNIVNPNYTYLWSSPQGSINFISGGVDSANAVVSISGTQTFKLLVTDNIAGCSDSSQVTITDLGGTPLESLSDATICGTSNNVQIGVSPLPNVSYSWLPTTDLSDPNIANPTASPTDTTTYVLSASLPGCADAIDTLVVNVPQIDYNSNRTIEFCSSGSPPSLGDSLPLGMISYKWTPNNNVNNHNIRNPILSTLLMSSTSSHNVLMELQTGCNYLAKITTTPITAPPISIGNTNICLGNSIAIGSDLNPTGPNYTYSWTPSTNLDDNTSHNPIFTPPSEGVYNYTFTKTDIGNTCTSETTVSINVVEDYQLPADTTIDVCENAELNIGIPIEPFVKYQWIHNSTITVPTVTIAPVNDTVYTLRATNQYDCIDEINFYIDVITGVQAPTISLPSTIEVEPYSDTILTPIISPIDTGTYRYQWSTDIGFIQPNTYAVNPTATVFGPGDYNFFLKLTTEQGCLTETQTTLQARAVETDLSLSLTPNNPTPMVGDIVTFTITITNSGIIDATGVAFETHLPAPGYTLTSVNGGNLGGNNSGLWSGITIPAGQSVNFTFQTAVNTPTGIYNTNQFDGEYTVYAEITKSDLLDPDSSPNNFNGCSITEDDEDCAAVAVITTPADTTFSDTIIDLELDMIVSNTSPEVGNQIVYTIEITNRGPLNATGVSVISLLPNELQYISNIANIGSYNPTSGIWDIGNIDVGEVYTLEISVQVLNSKTEMFYTNTAQVYTANEDDIDSSPNNNIEGEDDQKTITISPTFDIIIPEGFSPNGDGLNDVFEIVHLGQLYPNFKLLIYNRYGAKMYEYLHNGNPQDIPIWWNGMYKNEIAPTGTYFYTLHFNDGSRNPAAGDLYLNK